MLAAWDLHPSQRQVRQHPVPDDHGDESSDLCGAVVNVFRGGQDVRHGIVLHLEQEPVRVVVEGQVAQPGDEWGNPLQIRVALGQSYSVLQAKCLFLRDHTLTYNSAVTTSVLHQVMYLPLQRSLLLA